MHIGKDFKFVAKLILAIIRAIFSLLENDNGDTDSDGKDVV